MPRKIRRARSAINRFTFELEQDLTHGPSGGLDRGIGGEPLGPRPPDPMMLRAAWIHHRHRLMGKYEGDGLEDPYAAGCRPWAFWEFEAPDFDSHPSPYDGAATDYLRRHGLLSDEEEAHLSALHQRWPDDVRKGYCRCRKCLREQVMT